MIELSSSSIRALVIISVKVSSLGGRVVNRQPEFEDLKAAARRFNLPLKSVRDEVMALLIEEVGGAGEET